MRYYEIIRENVDQTIVLDARKAVYDTTRTFVKDNLSAFFSQMEKEHPSVTEMKKQLGLANAAMLELGDENYSNPEYQRLADKISNLKSDLYGGSEINRLSDSDFIERMTTSYTRLLEEALKKVAVDGVEEKYGKIEKYDKNTKYEDFKKYFNLYFLQHIIVHIDVVKSEELSAESNKSGRIRDGGGHFNRDFFGQKAQDEYKKAAGGEDIDFNHEFGSGITIFANQEKMWDMLQNAFLVLMQMQYFGEAYSHQRTDVLTKIISVFTHEYVHLLQYILKHIKHEHGTNIRGLTYIGNGKRGKNKVAWDSNNKLLKLRGGKRQPDYLGGNWSDITPERYENYFGTTHEIEAHAAQTAAEYVNQYMDENQSRYGYHSQSDLNYFIDSTIENLKHGYAEELGSLGSYQNIIKSKIKDVDTEIGHPLPKADELHRKVWRKFMTKLVKALLQFKKPIKDD